MRRDLLELVFCFDGDVKMPLPIVAYEQYLFICNNIYHSFQLATSTNFGGEGSAVLKQQPDSNTKSIFANLQKPHSEGIGFWDFIEKEREGCGNELRNY